MTTSRTIRWVLLIAALAAAGYFGWQRFHRGDQPTAANSAQKSAPNPVRVSIAPVEKADFPVYLTGLGTVQGVNTVSVRTRVAGPLDKSAFTDSQQFNQGY